MRQHDDDNDYPNVHQPRNNQPDNYSRLMGNLDGLPDVEQTRPTTIRHIPPLGVGGVETFTVQTFRQREVGDYIFLEHSSASGTIRLAIPPKVAQALLRQHDQLSKTVRRKTGQRVAKDRMDAGIMPGFLKKRA